MQLCSGTEGKRGFVSMTQEEKKAIVDKVVETAVATQIRDDVCSRSTMYGLQTQFDFIPDSFVKATASLCGGTGSGSGSCEEGSGSSQKEYKLIGVFGRFRRGIGGVGKWNIYTSLSGWIYFEWIWLQNTADCRCKYES